MPPKVELAQATQNRTLRFGIVFDGQHASDAIALRSSLQSKEFLHVRFHPLARHPRIKRR
jgi:hypothetical protein